MCGIAGLFIKQGDERVSEDVLVRMISALRHRGPDESGIYIDPRLGMGNTRLSIIGVDGGTQPIENEDGTLRIVFNGEAFNYIELKDELIQKGHRFATRTDTEVVLHLYEEFGADCLAKINGQFAFAAIWDAARKELFFARDRGSIRPARSVCRRDRVSFRVESRPSSSSRKCPGNLTWSRSTRSLPFGPRSAQQPLSRISASFRRATSFGSPAPAKVTRSGPSPTATRTLAGQHP